MKNMSLSFAAFDRVLEALGCRYLADEPMALHTTMRVGGPASRFVTAENLNELKALLAAVREFDIPYLILGNGSNLLVADEGIDGAVISLSGDFKKIGLLPGSAVSAGAGAQLANVCAFARDNALSGLEFAYGIPGTLGGAVFMDAGAYGGEMRDVVYSVTHITAGGDIETLAGEALAFGYRESRYKSSREVILSAQLGLKAGEVREISSRMEELILRRRMKQPYDLPSAGSVFKRPKDGYAAALIEESGLKGARVGMAQVSEKHAGFIVNLGGAKCSDVLGLIEKVRTEVLRQTGIELECEVRLVGGEYGL